MVKLSQEILHLSFKRPANKSYAMMLGPEFIFYKTTRAWGQTCLQYFSKLVQWSSLWLKTQDCFNRHVSIDLLTSATTKKTTPPSKAPNVERQSSWSARSPFEDTEERMNSKGNERFAEHVVKHAVKHSKHDELFSWHTHTHMLSENQVALRLMLHFLMTHTTHSTGLALLHDVVWACLSKPCTCLHQTLSEWVNCWFQTMISEPLFCEKHRKIS